MCNNISLFYCIFNQMQPWQAYWWETSFKDFFFSLLHGNKNELQLFRNYVKMMKAHKKMTKNLTKIKRKLKK